MYTLTHINLPEDNIGAIYTVQAPELEEEYQNAGYQKYERNYKLIYQHKEYTVICPEYRSDEIGASPIVIIPVFLIPRRPYPVHVYLYAIDLYSNNPAMGQRKAGEMTRELFGLPHFAHTTLGRALKAFVRNIEETTGPSEEYHNDDLCEADKGNVIQHGSSAKCDENSQESNERKQFIFPTTQSTAAWRKRAAQILEEKISWALEAPKQLIKACFEFAKEWFKLFCRFLM